MYNNANEATCKWNAKKSKFVSNFLQKETINFQIMLFVLHASHNVYPIIWTLDYKEFISNQYPDVQISCKSVLHVHSDSS